MQLHAFSVKLTVMVDGVDEPDSYVRMVIGHQHNVEQLLTLWVQLTQSGIHCLQSLMGYRTKRKV